MLFVSSHISYPPLLFLIKFSLYTVYSVYIMFQSQIEDEQTFYDADYSKDR